MTTYEVLTRPEVEGDLRQLSKERQTRVLEAIRQRLVTSPHLYGKPLGGALAGLRRIRVGDDRVAYQIQGRRVIVWAVKHRKDIYDELEQRRRKSSRQ